MNAGRERRKHHRRKVELAVKYHLVGGPLLRSRLRDMSIGGCFVETAEQHPACSRLTLTLCLPSSSTDLVIAAEIRWSCPEGMGVRFGTLKAQQMVELIGYLADKPAQSPSSGTHTTDHAPSDETRSASGSTPLNEQDRMIGMLRADLLALRERLGERAAGLDDLALLTAQPIGLPTLVSDPLLANPNAWELTVPPPLPPAPPLPREARAADLGAPLEVSPPTVAERSDPLESWPTEIIPRTLGPDSLLVNPDAWSLENSRPPEAQPETPYHDGLVRDELAHLQAELAKRDGRIAELEAALSQREEQLTAARSAAAANDDLTLIKGIGPKYAQALRTIGIRRFEQIAAWTAADIADAARRLNVTPRRIHRAAWVANAAALVAKRQGE